MASQPPELDPASRLGDPRADKEWLRDWWKQQQSNIQWAKSQGWNSVQWCVALIGAIWLASREYTAIRWCWIWGDLVILVALIGTWWQYDLHGFARSSRRASEGLLADYTPRKLYLPERDDDRDHFKLLRVRLAVVWVSAGLTWVQLYRGTQTEVFVLFGTLFFASWIASARSCGWR
jgi:hypothetical protein